MSVRHVLWVNELANLRGGCEYYVFNTARLLRAQGICSSLLYDGLQGDVDAEMRKVFDHVFPMADIPAQVSALAPDMIYVHRVNGTVPIFDLTSTGIPSIRFLHDHKLLCLREHKYTTLGHKTCTQPIGLRCYPCLGFVTRGTGRWGVRFRTVGALRREQRINARFDGLAVGSAYMAQHLAAHGFAREKTHVLPLYSFPADGEKPETRSSGNLLFAGQLVRGKGLDILLRAMTLTRHAVRLWVVGAGRQEGMFKAQCDSLGLSGRVDFLGKMPPETLSGYYRRATCLVFPSRQPETFGLIGPEAMSRSTPVIASKAGGITEWLEDQKTGIAVPPNDPQALAEAIDRLVEDNALREEMGRNALKQYEAAFRPERHIMNLTNLFESVAARKRG